MLPKQIAYLGPEGTNTHHALLQLTRDYQSDLISLSSISEVFNALVQDRVDAGFVPIENIEQGPVTETLDALYRERNSVYIELGCLKEISHGFGTLSAESGEVIEIYSHPQAIQQCSEYIRQHHSNAVIVHVASTAEAARTVKKNKLRGAAVIAPNETLRNLGFHVHKEDISNIAGNKTRFVLLRRGALKEGLQAAPDDEHSGNYVTSLVVNPGKDRQGILFEILEILSVRNKINLLSIHSRPDSKGGFLFFLDLEGHISNKSILEALNDLRDYCRHETGDTAGIAVFGSYARTPFASRLFSKVGIVGGKGVMGQWFEKFFTENGYDVASFDVDSSIDISQFVSGCEVIILSVPMSAAEEVIENLSPHLKPGQLVVENCSIKNSSLPHLEKAIAPDVELLGFHTMFAGDISDVRGQNIIITETERSGKVASAFCSFFYKHGARITGATATEHDSASAYLQSLLHLMLIAFADALQKSYESIDEVAPFRTPNSRNVLTSLERVLRQDEKLSADLQLLNAEAVTARHRFLESICLLSSTLYEGNSEELLKMISKGREFISKNSKA